VPPDDRIEPLCDQIVQTVEQWGFAEVTDVPGDQAAVQRHETVSENDRRVSANGRSITDGGGGAAQDR
jgi:hypothetical protein